MSLLVFSKGSGLAGPVPKLCGGDVELGNFITGIERREGSGGQASRALLKAVKAETGGIPADNWRSRVRIILPAGRRFRGNPQDSGRIFLPGNGGSVYIDLDHLELCLPEVRSAHDHVAAWHAMLRIAQRGLTRANADREPDRRIQALANNSDGWGNSYGGHLNILVGRSAWEGIMRRRLHHLALLASYQASAVIFTGQGKVGSENERPLVPFQLSQRADFIETLLGPQTTFFRPLVNTRDEPHSAEARLHLICFDTTLAEPACLLRVGVTQMILAMIEAERVNPALALDDPVGAIQLWSQDPSLETRVPLAHGGDTTAVELQQRLLEEALDFAASGGFEEVVPRAGEILALWQDTLERLARQDWPGLVRRLDWVAKLALIERAMAERPDLEWSAPEFKVLDHLYASLDPEEGLFFAISAAGQFERVVEPARVEHFTAEPPEDTRAHARAHFLREAGAERIDQVDWDRIRFRLEEQGMVHTLVMPNPLDARVEWESVQPEAAPAESGNHRKPRSKNR